MFGDAFNAWRCYQCLEMLSMLATSYPGHNYSESNQIFITQSHLERYQQLVAKPLLSGSDRQTRFALQFNCP